MSDYKSTSFFGLLVYLIEKKKICYSVLFFTLLPVISLLVIFAVLWIILHPTLAIVGDGTVLKFQMNTFSPEVYRILIHPRGWQETGISVESGDTIKVSVSGQVTVGIDIKGILTNSEIADTYMSNVKQVIKDKEVTEVEAMEVVTEEMTREKQLQYQTKYRYGWPWTDYKGYKSDLPAELDKIPSRFSLDSDLIAHGYSAGRLLGYASKEPGFIEKAKERTFEIEHSKIIDFGTDIVRIPDGVEKGSKLYLIVNDSNEDIWLYDNLGYFLVTIQK